ncbi:MAG: hypothetical protein KJ949_00350 [Nanoarchaeota archaeon]|nr:hypothetical protein [Nanoarchaeota archaeon]MBU4308837.1 hypothetical protein [Nanoarchaeota archaeon]
MVYEWLAANKEILKIFFGLIIGIICTAIVLRTHRLFKLSSHQGIRYFRNAFLFYGIGFLVRYILGAFLFFNLINPAYRAIITGLFEYFLIMAGFFLLYSLIWKNIEGESTKYSSSLINPKISLFYIMALILVILDCFWGGLSFMLLSQVVLFAVATIISYMNYSEGKKQFKFRKFYFVAMLLNFLAWLSNTLVVFFFKGNQNMIINIYFLNLIIFFLFLYGVIKVTGLK